MKKYLLLKDNLYQQKCMTISKKKIRIAQLNNFKRYFVNKWLKNYLIKNSNSLKIRYNKIELIDIYKEYKKIN